MKKQVLNAMSVTIALIIMHSCSDKVVEKPFIDPPFPHISPEYTEFTVNAEEGGVLEYETGTSINIPRGIWTDAQGKPIKGDVKIKYREFHDAFDIFLSGVTMDYDTAGVKESFTTAGMFEIRAYKDTSEIFIKQGSNVKVKMASYKDESDYKFYSLNENEKKWKYQGYVKPEINENIALINDSISLLQKEQTFPFDKKKYFALSADAILDVYFKDNKKVIYKNKKNKMPVRKAETYGLSWKNINGTNWIKFQGAEFMAYQMVWENLSSHKVPNWGSKKYHYISKLTYLGDNTYYMTIEVYPDKKASIKVRAVMPMKYLFAYPPDHWQEKYDEILKRIEEEQQRLSLQCDVYRSFDISATGFHNWDKINKRTDRVLVKSDFKFDKETDELADIDVFYFTDNNKSFIKINLAATDTLILVPDSTAKLIAVLDNNKAGYFSTKDYQKIKFDKLKKDHVFTFKMKTYEVNSRDDFMKFIEN